ncbi:MAG: hypothetical protein A3F26_00415 [Candidatus Ryanbacteria bacterium RIFCSPHIGHO2_12_FULL_47_12b]|uniref:Uncharacterized protein n=1 Tax=Candidatus Ryanbacteria bacterium RIFCSPLOWO2_02_FULL_47_14 TaxID=1802129 RepID=A0A1G2H2F7_9BACT|nr:MAG: hypothetical protein UX74_C0023G0020 [Parcubacteria group bacterium GW2011_GWA2_47_10b]KKU85790.1 MAG: hypothetical protein UY14_C0013G0003 [Parcubacteria group bacterium GW2011_GWA1_47_9]OGZ44689.1 MAG: hypothetical protein A2844_02395 [Candidatus Ryanbacteria bacterium RIFCSPHIGHO2_01_FULL_48_80]OGZ49880.1 MAG: hypothetical protein A3C83_01005 [Candidatus Ryanbacteria bacterium RIFCSPHIGHO2_02_FULL_47_25]OGZ51428.1 MAG: hypothetical protein A3A29_02440 [Candidatus Ryanbacteria bacteri
MTTRVALRFGFLCVVLTGVLHVVHAPTTPVVLGALLPVATFVGGGLCVERWKNRLGLTIALVLQWGWLIGDPAYWVAATALTVAAIYRPAD